MALPAHHDLGYEWSPGHGFQVALAQHGHAEWMTAPMGSNGASQTDSSGSLLFLDCREPKRLRPRTASNFQSRR